MNHVTDSDTNIEIKIVLNFHPATQIIYFVSQFNLGWDMSRIQLFWERLSFEVYATTPKGIVEGFEFTVFQRNLKEWQERPWTLSLQMLKERNKSRFDSYSVRNSVLSVSHLTFPDNCRVHIFSDNLSQNSCISPDSALQHSLVSWVWSRHSVCSGGKRIDNLQYVPKKTLGL